MSRSPGALRLGGVRFDRREVRDLLAAWIALGVAFALFFGGGAGVVGRPGFVTLLALSLSTAGVGFLAHELAHKVVAVRFGQVAGFRADYGMLALAILSALAGFIFAAPGAVHHRGVLTRREGGLIALAGPATNLALAVVFLPLVAAPFAFLARLGVYGVGINLLLAAFNMLPFGPLDGRTVAGWSRAVFALAFAASALAAIGFALWLFG